jgi:hypothetical protein
LLIYERPPIHYSWLSSILVFFKLTPNICFSSLFNCKVLIVICHIFFDILNINSYIKDFFNWKLPCMSKPNKGKKVFFQNMWTKGYHIFMSMVSVKNCYQKNTNAFTCCVTNTLHVWLFFHTWQIDSYI